MTLLMAAPKRHLILSLCWSKFKLNFSDCSTKERPPDPMSDIVINVCLLQPTFSRAKADQLGQTTRRRPDAFHA